MTVFSAVDRNVSPPFGVLLVSPFAQDRIALEEIFQEDFKTSRRRWILCAGATTAWGVNMLRISPIPIVLCERDLDRGATWRDLLAQTETMAHAPLLLVASRFADEALWAEVLNLGAYDVLAKPFDGKEVTRVLAAARHQWEELNAPVEVSQRAWRTAS